MFVYLDTNPRRPDWTFHVVRRHDENPDHAEQVDGDRLADALEPAMQFHMLRHLLRIGLDYPSVDEFGIGIQPGSVFITSIPVPA